MVKVLFVCLGNICRSPLAESIFVQKAERRNIKELVRVDSCGTSNYNEGCPPDPRTRRNASANGVQMTHVARQLSRQDFADFDMILVMDSENLRHALSVCPDHHHHKIRLMRSYDPLGTGDVPDPFYGGDRIFQAVFEMLDRSVEALIDHLIQTKGR
ncbi:MAG: low molecular weight protein-tyrosine-phosphatase [Cytophagales bacterium]|nr:low molecular weight protein-tyrosine-phosphatase [Cytophagales bacterium]